MHYYYPWRAKFPIKHPTKMLPLHTTCPTWHTDKEKWHKVVILLNFYVASKKTAYANATSTHHGTPWSQTITALSNPYQPSHPKHDRFGESGRIRGHRLIISVTQHDHAPGDGSSCCCLDTAKRTPSSPPAAAARQMNRAPQKRNNKRWRCRR